MWHPLWDGRGWGGGAGGYSKNEILSDVGGWGVSECSDVQSLFFLLKKIGFVRWPGIMMSHILIYYWQEIFLLTLTSGIEVRYSSDIAFSYCILKQNLEHVTLRVRGGKFIIKWKKPNPNPNLWPSNIFYRFVIKFMSLSWFLWLYHFYGLFTAYSLYEEIMLVRLYGNHPLMIPLHCLWAELNNRARGQVKYDVTWFCFCFDFVRFHARFGCCSIVYLHFHVVQIKQVDCKMSTKNMNDYK